MNLLGSYRVANLFERARSSDRLRAHLNLHENYEEKVQRILIALVRGSYVEPHYHELAAQWEMFTVLQGVIEVKLYKEDGMVISSYLVGEGQDALIVHFEPGDIHSVECVSGQALMLEVKEGPFIPKYAKNFPVFKNNND